MPRSALLALALAFAAATPLQGQSQVVGVRDLNFGVVIPGIQTSVAPSDPIRSGRFYILHQLNHQVRVNLTLPNQLPRVGGGGNLKINFGPGDAVAQGTAANSNPVVFNPHSPITFSLTTSADFYLNLGGQVSPAAGQVSGTYTGTVLLTCTFY
jgi:hypothetical protein